MNYGQRAKELILELKRSDWLPPYNDEGVKSIQAEIKSHFEELHDLAKALDHSPSDGDSKRTDDQSSSTTSARQQVHKAFQPVMLLHDAAILRNKRCLLAYHQYRLDKLKQWRWETSAVLPTHVRSLLSEGEQEFYAEYDKLISWYSESISGSSRIDLNSNLQPPEEDWILIRVLKQGLGTMETEFWGAVNLDMGTTHFLPRADVEHLIRQGYLEQLDGEEMNG
jgi:GINS complex subunit 1